MPRSEEAIQRAKTKYYLAHKDEVIARTKEHRATHGRVDSEADKAWRASHKEEILAAGRKYYSAHPERAREKSLKKWYGITLADYNQMFEEQNGFCIICGVHQSEVNKTFCVDHDHETGEVRGLLCDQCNKGLGHFKDNQSFLQKAIDYLRRV
jgi:hypothetical protein